MKKVAIGVAGVALVLVAAGLLGPRFVNWNAYKDDIAEQVLAATGRQLEIAGSIEVSFLPPSATVEGIQLSNMNGAAVAHMATLERARVSLAFLPLLTGKIEVASLTLVGPVVELETLADGRTNWTFDPQAVAKPGAADTPTAPPTPRRREAFSIGQLVIEDGTIVYRDSRTGALERVDALDAELTLASAEGPVSAKGSAAPRGVPMRFDVSVGAFGGEAPVPIALSLDVDGGAGRLEIKGEATKLGESGAFSGKLRVEAGDPLKLSRSLFGGAEGSDGLPGALAQRVTLDASVAASASQVAVTELVLAHGESQAKGSLEARFGKTPRFDAKLAVNRLDLDAMTAAPPPKGKDGEKRKAGSEKPPVPAKAGKPAPARPSGEGFSIPADVAGALDVTVNELRTNGADVRDVHVTGTLAGGALALSKVSATLPGATAVSASFNVTARKGAPAIDGTVNLVSDSARELLKWLKVDLAGVPEDRLKRVNFAGRVAMAGEDVQVRDATLAFDQSRVTGAANVALRKRPAFGANVTIDRLDLDAYLPAPGKKPAQTGGAGGEASGGQASPAEAKAASPLAALAPLEAFDANVQVRVGTLGYRKMAVQGLVLDATLAQGVLTVRELAAQDFAGASGRVGGTLSGFTGQPQVKANLDVRAADAARFLKAVGVQAGGAEKLGRLALIGSINTNVKDAALDVALQLAGGSLKMQGPVTGLGGAMRYDLNLAADFPDMGALLRSGGGQGGARLGALRLSGKGQGDAANLNLSQLKGTVGPVALSSGEIKLAMGGARPKIAATLVTGDVPLDAFGSPQVPKPAAAPGRAGAAPGSTGGSAAATGGQRWSREPIDMAALKSADGEFRIQSTAIRSGKIAITNAVIDASLLDGTLEIKSFTGRLFDGAFSAKGKVQTSPAAEMALSLEQFDVNQALRGLADLDRATGRATLRATLKGVPKTEYDFVSSLAGNGTLDGTLTVKLKSEEVAGAGLLGALGRSVGGLQGIGGMAEGLFMAFGAGQGTLKGTFQADRGIVRTNDLALTNPQATTRVVGQADLPNWTVDGQGTVATAGAQQPVFTVAAKGPLDQPSMKFGGTGIQGTNPLQQILPGLLGKPQQQPQQQQPSQQQKKPTLQDILKGVTKP